MYKMLEIRGERERDNLEKTIDYRFRDEQCYLLFLSVIVTNEILYTLFLHLHERGYKMLEKYVEREREREFRMINLEKESMNFEDLQNLTTCHLLDALFSYCDK